MRPRLHVLLGAGGVGKTTLAAGYALALAERGARVGLIGIDPSRRLEEALGVTLVDLDTPVAGAGQLRAAIVQPHQAIERWVLESDPGAARALATNPFFIALGDRLATATDIFAAARIAEWAERDPDLDELVVDTAPGLAAIEFLRSPRQLEALVKGRLVRWMRAASRGRMSGAARRVLGAFAGLAGSRLATQLGDFFTISQVPLERLVERVEHARHWIASDETEILLVTSPRDAHAAGAAQIARSLRELDLAPRAVIVNRTWPPAVVGELASLDSREPLVDHARALLAAQAAVVAEVMAWKRPLVLLGSSAGLAQRAALAALGSDLADELQGPPRLARSAS